MAGEQGNHADDLARLRAEMDQAKEGTREFAGAVWTFYKGLQEVGFSQKQALQLTQAWMVNMIQTAPLSGVVGEAEEMFKRLFGGEGDS